MQILHWKAFRMTGRAGVRGTMMEWQVRLLRQRPACAPARERRRALRLTQTTFYGEQRLRRQTNKPVILNALQ